MKLKPYFWKPEKYEENGIAIIAENVKEAKRLGWEYWGIEYGNDYLFTEQRVNIIKDANIKGLNKGIVIDFKDGLKRGLYGWVENVCPVCGNLDTLYYDEDTIFQFGCEGCLHPDNDI